MPATKTSAAATAKTWAIRLVLVGVPIAIGIYFPKTFGAIVVIFLLVLGALWLAWLWLKGKVKGALKTLGSNISEMHAFTDVIDLEPFSDPTVEESDEVVGVAETLESLGFTGRTIYSRLRSKDLRLIGLVHPENGTVAVIYCGTGNVEYIALHGESTYVSYTNSDCGTLRMESPETIVFTDKGIGATALYAKLNEHAMDSPRTPVAPAAFPAFLRAFQEKHADLRKAERKAEEARAHALREAYMAKSGWTEDQMESDEHRIQYVYDEEKTSSLVNTFMSLIDWDNEMDTSDFERHEAMAEEKLETMPKRAAFAALLAEHNLGGRIEKLFELEEPFPADVYWFDL